MTFRIAIVGAGVLGRLVALGLRRRAGVAVTLFDRAAADDPTTASAVAAGMLAPFCELAVADRAVFELGLASLPLWSAILGEIARAEKSEVFFRRHGSLVVSHLADRPELAHFLDQVDQRLRTFTPAGSRDSPYQRVTGGELHELEPSLARRFSEGIYFPHEGQIDGRDFLRASTRALAHAGVELRFGTEVEKLGPGRIHVAGAEIRCDLAIDCRGAAARGSLRDLRGVRGEVIKVRAAGVSLRRPLRLMHARHPIYLVPRPDEIFLIGATEIESEDASPVSVRSALELLSAAFTVNSGFGEARILEMSAGVRPAFPDNRPRIVCENGWIRANGLYRHGYLVAPRFSELVVACALGEEIEAGFSTLVARPAHDGAGAAAFTERMLVR